MNTTGRCRILLISLVFVGAVCGVEDARGADGFIPVRWVDDGDTIVLADGRRIRYIGINAPEVAHEGKPAEAFGAEARAFNRSLVYKKKVRLELDEEKFDQYNRVLAYVFLQDGTFVNAELVKTGHAWFVSRKPNRAYDSTLLALQREAMAKRLVIWERFPNHEGPFLGNRRSRRFHRMSCPFGSTTREDNRTVFKTAYDAFWDGYSPCKKCSRFPFLLLSVHGSGSYVLFQQNLIINDFQIPRFFQIIDHLFFNISF